MATENYLLLGQKKRMIEGLREKGITDENVLGAFDKMERHLFLESLLWPRAYEDEALKLATDQTISKPSTVAFQSQLLEVSKGMKVLEIGTGSGFQAAILYAMGARVFTVERQITLFNRTRPLLSKLSAVCALRQSYCDLWGSGDSASPCRTVSCRWNYGDSRRRGVTGYETNRENQ